MIQKLYLLAFFIISVPTYAETGFGDLFASQPYAAFGDSASTDRADISEENLIMQLQNIAPAAGGDENVRDDGYIRHNDDNPFMKRVRDENRIIKHQNAQPFSTN